jgi:hypothetical protein
MYDNGRPAILASTLPYAAHAPEGQPKVVACPDCGTFRLVKRHLITQHPAADELADCPGSYQLITFDVTAEQDAALCARRQAAQLADAPKVALRRSARTQLKPTAPLPRPVAHLGRDRTPRRAQIAGWSQFEAIR